MTDTPKHIQDLQLQLWLAKSPAERIRQFLISNDELHAFWRSAKQQMEEKYPSVQNQPK